MILSARFFLLPVLAAEELSGDVHRHSSLVPLASTLEYMEHIQTKNVEEHFADIAYITCVQKALMWLLQSTGIHTQTDTHSTHTHTDKPPTFIKAAVTQLTDN